MDNWVRLYTVNPPTLRKLASQEIAAMSCRYRFKSHCKNEIFRLEDIDADSFVFSCQLKIDVDFLNKIFMSSVFWPVSKAIESWLFYNDRYVYDDLGSEPIILNCLDDLVLKPDGTICYLSTAKNLLAGDKLSPLQKYRLACVNCLVEDIRKLWPLVSTDRRFHISHDGDILFDYWARLMMGESLRLSGTDAKSTQRREEILKYSKWPAVEYFFDKLTVHEQVNAAMALILDDDENIIERILLKSNNNEEFRRRFLRETTFRMILSNREYWYFSTSHLWDFMKYFITGKDFCNVICLFIRDYRYEFLFKLCTTAPDHLKKFVRSDIKTVEKIFDAFKNYVFCYDYWSYYSDMRFFSALLNDLSFKLRNSLWRKYWRFLIVGSRPEFLETVMKICFNDDNEILQFKEREMMNFNNIENFSALLFKFGYFRELTDFLNFCSTDIDRVSALRVYSQASEIRNKN